MRSDEYPPQEPLSKYASEYHAEVTRLAGDYGERARDFRYGGDPYNSVAVFASEQPTGDVLCFIHGGGWTNGYKEWCAFMAPGLNAAGVTLVSIGYRLAPAHTFPTGLTDCEDAVAWTHRHIAEHGGDPQRLFVGGHSAGGHYASLIAVRHGWRAVKGVDAGAIRGCLPISGVYLFGEDSGMKIRPPFLGAPGNEVKASALLNLEPDPPPFFIAVGERDWPHLVSQSAEMETALRDIGGDVTRMVLAGCSHFEAHYTSGDPDGPWLAPAVSWMRSR